MTTQLALDETDPDPRTEAFGDLVATYLRTVCADLGIKNPEQALLHQLRGDNRHLDITADSLLLHLEEVEDDDLLDENSLFYRCALLGARELVSHAVFEALKTGWTS